jgi:uncharacterized membrane protein YedE/YeeE
VPDRDGDVLRDGDHRLVPAPLARRLMAIRALATVFGLAFGFLISWGQFTDPDRIRRMLLFEDWYLYLMFASAVAVGYVGVRVLRRARFRALLTGDPVSWETPRPERRHIVGSLLFGIGWAVSDACPGPIAAQVGRGFAWSLATAAGVFVGVFLYYRRAARATRSARVSTSATSVASASTTST